MQWNQRLAAVRKNLHLKQDEVVHAMHAYLAKEDWVRIGTLSSWEKGRTQPKIQQALALASVYQVDPYSIFGTPAMGGGLNQLGQEKLSEFRELLLASEKYRAAVEVPRMVPRMVRYLPVYLQPASAGTGQWLDDDLSEEMEVDDSVPASAEFGVRLAGDSMSPRFADGQIVWARRSNSAENGEIVLCVLNEQGYCKKLHRNIDGVALISLNPAYQPILITENDQFQIMGTVVG